MSGTLVCVGSSIGSSIIASLLTRWWLWTDVYRSVRQIMLEHDCDLIHSLSPTSFQRLLRDSNREIH